MTQSARLDRILADLPQRYAGPGGAVAVLREGKVLAQQCWGWADMARRLPFTSETMFLVCSISKQFTCALMLDQVADPTELDGDVRRMLPSLHGAVPGALDLAHNQSGLRDYWAAAMLCGAPVEGVFTNDDAQRLIRRTASLQFAPGTRNSYVNQNFRILSDILVQRSGQEFGTLLRRRIFDRAGMPRAVLNADTASVVGGTQGYEGSVEQGFRAAVNRIHWTGDAGIAASLDDLIAWERFIDATRDQADGLYARQSAPQRFRDGAPAAYGFGLNHATLLGRPATSHGGGLRGWRSFRLNLPAERVSVVVLFNHMADARAAALEVLAALLDTPAPATHPAPAGDWTGRFEEPETGLAVRLEAAEGARLRLHFAPGPETLSPTAEGGYAGGGTRLRRTGDGLWMERAGENLATRLLPCPEGPADGVEGVFHCAELAADLICLRQGGVLYGAFSGDLGQGEMLALQPFGRDIWLLPCPRALDYSAPGDWTLKLQRDAGGRVVAVRVGCWLARGLVFTRTA